MSKPAKQTADAFSIPVFDTAEQARQIAENGVAQSMEAYAKAQDHAEVARKVIETTLKIAQLNTAALSLKTLAALRANSEASFVHLEALFGVKSFSDLIDLQSGFAHKQAEAITTQVKEFQVVAIKALEEVSAPVKLAVEKASSAPIDSSLGPISHHADAQS